MLSLFPSVVTGRLTGATVGGVEVEDKAGARWYGLWQALGGVQWHKLWSEPW